MEVRVATQSAFSCALFPCMRCCPSFLHQLDCDPLVLCRCMCYGVGVVRLVNHCWFNRANEGQSLFPLFLRSGAAADDGYSDKGNKGSWKKGILPKDSGKLGICPVVVGGCVWGGGGGPMASQEILENQWRHAFNILKWVVSDVCWSCASIHWTHLMHDAMMCCIVQDTVCNFVWIRDAWSQARILTSWQSTPCCAIWTNYEPCLLARKSPLTVAQKSDALCFPMCWLQRCTPSYLILPHDYPQLQCSGRTESQQRVLNDFMVSIPSGSEDSGSKVSKLRIGIWAWTGAHAMLRWAVLAPLLQPLLAALVVRPRNPISAPGHNAGCMKKEAAE